MLNDNGDELTRLTEKLNTWCAEQNLVPACAREMMWYDDLTREQSRWLSEFIDEWDEASPGLDCPAKRLA